MPTDRFNVTRSNRIVEAIAHPHSESLTVAEVGFASWGRACRVEDEGLLDPSAGKAVRWIPGAGWTLDPG